MTIENNDIDYFATFEYESLEDFPDTYYKRLLTAETHGDFDMVLWKLFDRVLIKYSVPVEVRTEFIEDVTSLRFSKFGNIPMISGVAERLSLYFLRDEVRTDEPGGARPACTYLEYAYDGYRSHKRTSGNLFSEFKELPVDFSEWYWETYPDFVQASHTVIVDNDELLQAVLTAAHLTFQERYVWELVVLHEMTYREIERYGSEPINKSTIGSRYGSAKKKVIRAYVEMMEEYSESI